jgi:hypothetical protein
MLRTEKGIAQNLYTVGLFRRGDFLGSRCTLVFDTYLLRISAWLRL